MASVASKVLNPVLNSWFELTSGYIGKIPCILCVLKGYIQDIQQIDLLYSNSQVEVLLAGKIKVTHAVNAYPNELIGSLCRNYVM